MKNLPMNTKIVKLENYKINEIKGLSNGQNLITSNFASKVRLPIKEDDKSGSKPFENLNNVLVPLILKEISKLLKEFKELNAFYHDDSIHYYNEVNIGYAIDLDKGLKVLNLGDLKEVSTEEINNRILDCIKKYLKNSFAPKDLFGITFSVTDVSSEDVLTFSPLINVFQSAILGVSSIDKHDGTFILNLVFDHRVTEGKKAAKFLKKLKKAIENKFIE